MARSSPSKVLARTILRRIEAVGVGGLAAMVVVVAAGGFLFAWSGLYSVAASKGHWPGFAPILEFGMRSSVRTHALGIEVPDLADTTMAERGASHFQAGCAQCHGAPGQSFNPLLRGTLPEPPDLAASAPTWKPSELFWIVKNGLKYTGMPAWPALGRDDEVWDVVAFLRRLPGMSTGQYRALAGLERREEPLPARDLAQGGPDGIGLAACARCHGLDGAGRANGAFPRLDIQTADYLLAQLQAYAAGTRQSGFMQPATHELETAEMRRLADYYAQQRPVVPTHPAAGQEAALDLGRKLVEVGLPQEGIPPCASCHGRDAASRHPLYPALDGQHAGYTARQLALFKSAARRGTAAADIMSVVAQRMTAEQREAVSIYLAGLRR